MASVFAADAFENKAVLVTGSTSGIGAGTARSFAAHGANVMVSGRNRERGEAVVAEIRQAGAAAELMIGDVADRTFCDRLVEETVTRFGRLDVLFNNAGIAKNAKIDAMSDEDWHDLLAVNLSGAFYVARAAIRQMKRQKSGVIINMSSECGLIAYEDLAAYSATKAGVVMLTKVMALDHARDGIRVNAVCPGDIDTPMTDIGWQALGLSPSEIRQKLQSHIPIGRIGQPSDVAAAVMFLASDAAGFITGAILPVDGGTTTR